jgi:type III secretion protein D
MNAQTDMLQSAQLVLRVIAGRQKGAEYRLSPGIQVSIGHHLHHDIVLRNSEGKDVSLELKLTDGIAMLSVVAGEIQLLGRAVGPSETAPLPAYMPVGIGPVVFAIGNPASERWDEAAQISAAAAETQANDELSAGALAATAPIPIDRKIDGAIRHFSSGLRPFVEAAAMERRWPVYAMLAASLLLAILLFAPISGWVNERAYGAGATEEMLVRNGFTDLTVAETAGNGVIISGVLSDDRQLQRLRRLLDNSRPDAVIDVSTMDALAAGITDMLVAQNIDAEAKAGRGRNIRIVSEYLPADRQRELAAQIRADMPAIENIAFQIDDARGEPDLQYFFASDKYGLASFVDGDPAFITTADGTKWFKGAIVPTGHRILSIGNGEVRFEREGQIEELKISEPIEKVAARIPGAEEANPE